MANDWLPMRLDLWDDPRIVRIARDLGCTRAAAIGACYRLWALGNRFSIDGTLSAYDARMIDSMVEINGFTAVMETIGWIVVGPDGITIPNFEEWNSQGARRRIKENDRKAVAKAVARNRSASQAPHKRPKSAPERCAQKAGPEKRTEENRTEDRGRTIHFVQSKGGAGGEFDDEWECVVGEVFDVGVNDAATAVLRASEHGASPDDVREIVTYWATEPERWQYPEAVLHRRLMRFATIMPPDTGWDRPSDEYLAAQKNADARHRHAAQVHAQLKARKVAIEERARCIEDYRERSTSLVDEFRKRIEGA